MAQSVVTVFLILVLVALLPAAMLWGFLKLATFVSDDEQLRQFEEFDPEGYRTQIRTETTGTGLQLGPTDGEQHPRGDQSTPDRSQTAIDAEQTVTCRECGRENAARFDRCWNCVADL